MSEEIKRVVFGRKERTLTVFVPWDCGHHCPFCTTKEEYATKYPSRNLEKNFESVKESLRRMMSYDVVTDVVFTGGEPLSDVRRLKSLVDIACKDGRVNVFINTSLNVEPEKEQEALEFLRDENRITGISVSLPYVDAKMMNSKGFETAKRLAGMCTDEWCKAFNWMRINSVVTGKETPAQINDFLNKVFSIGGNELHIWSVNFRKDYRYCNQTNLNDCYDPTMATLMSMPNMLYVGQGGCLVCRNDIFWPRNILENDKDGVIHRVVYHRGTEQSSLRFGDLLVINDLVIKQDGEIRYDWIEGTAVPKRVMDVLDGKSWQGDGWKWKNHRFSHSLLKANNWSIGEMTCRDSDRYERCS